MRPLLQFEDYTSEGIIRRVKKDPQRAQSMIKQSERKTNSLKETLEKIGIMKILKLRK